VLDDVVVVLVIEAVVVQLALLFPVVVRLLHLWNAKNNVDCNNVGQCNVNHVLKT
jgi:hypothetical protein